jgi:Cu(I)-responsive transcriptional regulator
MAKRRAGSPKTARPGAAITSAQLTIGALGKAAAVKVETIRYYERIGLLAPPIRTASGYRLYGPEHVQRLAFIRHSRELGFHLDAIRELLALSDDPDRSCAEADRIARVHLREVEGRLASLQALRSELKRMIGQCSRNRIADCRVIGVLADHAHCLSRDHHSRAAPR